MKTGYCIIKETLRIVIFLMWVKIVSLICQWTVTPLSTEHLYTALWCIVMLADRINKNSTSLSEKLKIMWQSTS